MGRKANSREFRDKIEERKGTDWYDKAKEQGLYDPAMSRDGKTARYSGAEVRAEMRAGRGDRTTEEMTKYYEDAYASGQINLNRNAKDFLRENHGAVLKREGDGKDTSSTQDFNGGQSSEPRNPVGSPNVMNGATQGGTLGGDMSSNINGDNNTVSQDQNNTLNNNISNSFNKDYSDNSVRAFNYTPTRGQDFEPGLIGKATAAGFFDPETYAPKFVNKYIDMNRDAQRESSAQYDMDRRMSGKDDYRGQSKYAQAFDPAQMMQRVDNSVQESRDRADVSFNDIYGNMDDFVKPGFRMADRPNPIQDKTDETMKKYMDLLKA